MNTTFDFLFDDIFRNAFETPKGFSFTNCTNYPPYNILQLSDEGDKFAIELSCAGYSKDNLEVKLDKHILTIKGKPTEQTGKVVEGNLKRSKFTRSFNLRENIEVTSSKYSDGILLIGLYKTIPEEDKPRVIDIS